jgi:hypothetical protein
MSDRGMSQRGLFVPTIYVDAHSCHLSLGGRFGSSVNAYIVLHACIYTLDSQPIHNNWLQAMMKRN